MSSLGFSFGLNKVREVYATKHGPILLVICFIVLLAVILSAGCYMSDNFANVTGLNKLREFFSTTDAKSMDILLFMSPTCPWCQKTKDILSKEGTLDQFTVVDVTTPDGQKMATMYGVNGLPSFVSRKENTGIKGFQDSTKSIVDQLKKVKEDNKNITVGSGAGPGSQSSAALKAGGPSGPVSPDDIRDLKVILFYKDGCSWCRKAKDDADNLGLLPYLELLDIQTTEGQNALREFTKSSTPVPFFASRTTGKSTVGYKPYGQIITELK